MMTVLTLVADPSDLNSFSSIVTAAEARLADLGARNFQLKWLKKDYAVDISFEGSVSNSDLKDILDPVDYCLQPTEDRRKKLLLADMDSTIITVECIDELADFAGIKDAVSEITERAMRGELDFDDAFRSRVAMLKGLKESTLDETFEQRVVPTSGARTLIQTMKANGAYSALVSGGFTYFTRRIRDLIGFDMQEANELLFENGELTGLAAEPILNSQAKLKNLNRLLDEKGISRAQSMAIGDGANDIPMIEAAGLGVSFHAKPAAEAAADATIRYGDLTTLLYFQGYREDEFITN
ncbi:MAG: phosphoserine phosphatase SerB [Sneathiella sp.]|nr:phosphoserine phosphatase SerB [Sneathiella sp.]